MPVLPDSLSGVYSLEIVCVEDIFLQLFKRAYLLIRGLFGNLSGRVSNLFFMVYFLGIALFVCF